MSHCGNNRGGAAVHQTNAFGRPISLWTTTAITRWSNPVASVDPPGYSWSFTWATTIFDLRPDLQAKAGNLRQGFQAWDRSARLYVGLNGPNAGTFDGRNLSVTATDYIAVYDANVQAGAGSAAGSTPAPNLVPLGTRDVSSVFYPATTIPGQGNVLGGFAPPGTELGGGEGYPVRYWRVVFTFSFFVDEDLPLPAVPTAPTALVLNAGVY